MEALKLSRKQCCFFIPIKSETPPFFLLHHPHLNLFTPNFSIRAAAAAKITAKISSSDTNPRAASSRVSDELRSEAEQILEWPSVCSQISAFASTAMARARCEVAGLRIGGNREESEKLLEQTKAAASLPKRLDFSGVDDVLGIVRSAVDGALLTIPQLCAVERSVRGARGVFEQLEQISCVEEDSDRS